MTSPIIQVILGEDHAVVRAVSLGWFASDLGQLQQGMGPHPDRPPLTSSRFRSGAWVGA